MNFNNVQKRWGGQLVSSTPLSTFIKGGGD